MPKVQQIARHISQLMGFQSHYDDLVSSGLIGLMDAFNRFSPKKFTSFSTYASIRVRGSMIDEIRNQSWVSRSTIAKAKAFDVAHEKFEKSLGRRATDRELSLELGVKSADLPAFVQSASIGRVVQLDDYRSFNEKDRESLVATSHMGSDDPVEMVDRMRLRDLLEERTGHLKPKQREVIFMFYFEGLSNVEISKKLAISEGRVSQLHREALAVLRRDVDMAALFQCMYKNIAA